MEPGSSSSYLDRYDDLHKHLKSELSRARYLVEELNQELEDKKASEMEILRENNIIRQENRLLRHESRHRQQKQGKRLFVVALIDADSYVFKSSYLNKGTEGGRDAADALFTALQKHSMTLSPAARGDNSGGQVDILVKVFANVGDLSGALKRQGRIEHSWTFKPFLAGFSNRQPFFDVVDVGDREEQKEQTRHKFTENLKFFLDCSQCTHLVLGCAHDTGYAPVLEQLVGDTGGFADFVTLLEASRLPAEIKRLGLRTIRLDGILDTAKSYSTTTEKGTVEEKKQQQVFSGPPDQQQQVPEGKSNPDNPKKRISKLKPIVINEHGFRIDRPLTVHVAARNRVNGLCFKFHLRGMCDRPNCDYIHSHPRLTDEEFAALLSLARQRRCLKLTSEWVERKQGVAVLDCLNHACPWGHEYLGSVDDVRAQGMGSIRP